MFIPCLLTVFVLAITSHAQDSLKIERVEMPPIVDGVLSKDEWKAAAPIKIATQMEPVVGAAATELTEAFLMFDKENLYVAFRAYDSDPSGIRAPVSKRDAVGQDDFVSIWIDTFDDRRRAYAFRFNPLGVQEDGIFSEGDRSLNWDGVIESKGVLLSDGYAVEARIPFKTLRFRINETKTWGLHLFRSIARKQESASWVPLPREQQNILLLMGRLGGLDGIESKRTLELIPTVTASNTGTREAQPLTPSGASLNTVNKIDPGLTAIYQITPNLTLSAAINPDFSQIEADAPQITVNQRFPLFFEEKRPFFLEGAEAFRPAYGSAPQIIDTRQIVDPDWGVKLTGKIGKFGIGFLSASDPAPGLRLPSSNLNFGKNAFFNIARVTRDVSSGSTIGASFTDRRFAGSSNSVGTLDGRIRFSSKQFLAYQVSYSKTTELDGTKRSGGGAYLAYVFNDGKWDFLVTDSHYARNFRAQAGFIRRTGYDRIYNVTGRSFRPKEKSWWVKARPFVVALAFWDENRNLDESFLDPGIDLTFARGITVYSYVSTRKDTFLGRSLRSNSYNLRWGIDAFKRWSASGSIETGTDANFDPARIEVGDLFASRLTLTLRPISKLNSEFFWTKSSLKSRVNDDRLFSQDIIRNKTTFQIDRFNSIRSIVEYDTLQRRIGLSFLFAFTPSPNKAFYAGYSDLLFNGLDPLTNQRRSGVFRQSRTLFVKGSYSIRF